MLVLFTSHFLSEVLKFLLAFINPHSLFRLHLNSVSCITYCFSKRCVQTHSLKLASLLSCVTKSNSLFLKILKFDFSHLNKATKIQSVLQFRKEGKVNQEKGKKIMQVHMKKSRWENRWHQVTRGHSKAIQILAILNI